MCGFVVYLLSACVACVLVGSVVWCFCWFGDVGLPCGVLIDMDGIDVICRSWRIFLPEWVFLDLLFCARL